MNLTSLLKIMLLNLIMSVGLYGGWPDDLINIGSITFNDAKWDNTFNINLSRQNISEITKKDKAVVLYFFDVCFS